jgi:hypothetical protein
MSLSALASAVMEAPLEVMMFAIDSHIPQAAVVRQRNA